MTTTTDQHRHYFIARGAVTAAGLALGVVLTGCTTGPRPDAAAGTTTTSMTSATAAPTSGAERDIVVAGRHFRARCEGDGPAVIAVLDYGRSMDDTWPAVQKLGLHAQVCLYDRLGVGHSDAPPPMQTFVSQADDLDGVISGLGLTRPVVVFGDSLGAPIALTWASRHESDARAVVLLTPPPPGFMGPHGALNRLLPPKNPGDLALSNLRTSLDHYNDPALNRESLDPRSWDAYLQLPPTSTLLYDVIGTSPWLDAVDAKKVNDAWREGQSRVLRLSSSSQLISVPKEADWSSAIQTTLERAVQS